MSNPLCHFAKFIALTNLSHWIWCWSVYRVTVFFIGIWTLKLSKVRGMNMLRRSILQLKETGVWLSWFSVQPISFLIGSVLIYHVWCLTDLLPIPVKMRVHTMSTWVHTLLTPWHNIWNVTVTSWITHILWCHKKCLTKWSPSNHKFRSFCDFCMS